MKRLLAAIAALFACGVSYQGASQNSPSQSSVVAAFDCRSFGQTASDNGNLNIKYKTPIQCWASRSTVSAERVNGDGAAGEAFVPEVWFEWNWDDSSQGTASRTATAWDLGKSYGLVAAHVFAPSTYAETCNGGTNSLHTVTLTVYSLVGGVRESDSATMTVCVEDPATTWPTPLAYCDDADCSNDTFTGVVNPGTPSHGGNGTALQTILAWCGVNGSQRILVEGGITHTATAAAATGTNSCLIESYGASKATFDFNVSAARINVDGCAKMRISEVTFAANDANYSLLNPLGAEGCVLLDDWNVSATVGERLSAIVQTSGEDQTELFFNNFDFTAHCSQGVSCGLNSFYLHAENSAFINGQITASGEHSIRFPNFRWVVVDSVYMAMPGTHTAGKNLLTLRQDCRDDDDATGLPCNQEASGHTVAVTRSEFRPAADGAVALSLTHDGNFGNEGTQNFDMDFLLNVFAKVNDADSTPRVYIDPDAATGMKLERLRIALNAADLTWMDSSTESALHVTRGGTEYYIAGNAVSCHGNCVDTRMVVNGAITGDVVVKNNVCYENGAGSCSMFPSYSESADNQPETSDPWDRDGAAPGTDATFTMADVLITSSNTAIKNQGVITAYPVDAEIEAVFQSSDYDSGVDDE